SQPRRTPLEGSAAAARNEGRRRSEAAGVLSLGQEGPHFGPTGWTVPELAGNASGGLTFRRPVADASVRAADVKTISHATEWSRRGARTSISSSADRSSESPCSMERQTRPRPAGPRVSFGFPKFT